MDDLCEFNVSEIPEPVCLFVWSLPVHLPYWPAACLLRRFSVEMHHVCVCRLLSWPWVIHSTSDQWPWATFLLNSARLGDKARNVLVSYNSLRASPVASHCQGNLAFFLYSTAATKQPAIWVFLPKWPEAMDIIQRRDSLGRINSNWRRQQNAREAANADAMDMISALDSKEDRRQPGPLSRGTSHVEFELFPHVFLDGKINVKMIEKIILDIIEYKYTDSIYMCRKGPVHRYFDNWTCARLVWILK